MLQCLLEYWNARYLQIIMFMVSSNTIVDYQWPIKPAKIPSSPRPAQPSPAQHPATCIGKNIGNKNKGEVLSIGDHLTQLLRASSVVGRGWFLTLGSWDDGVTISWQAWQDRDIMADDQTGGTTFSLVRYNNPVVIDKEEVISRPKSAPASTGYISISTNLDNPNIF